MTSDLSPSTDDTVKAAKDAWVTRVLGVRVGGPTLGTQDDRAEMVASLMETLPIDLQALTQRDPDAVAEARKLFDAGQAAANKSDYATALNALQACADEVTRLNRLRNSSDARASVPEGTVLKRVRVLELVGASWAATRLQALDGLDALNETLWGEEDPELEEIARRVNVLIRTVPAALHTSLSALRQAVEAGDEQGVKSGKNAVSSQIQAARSYLSENAIALTNCEVNPWGIEVAIIQPFNNTLKNIETAISVT